MKLPEIQKHSEGYIIHLGNGRFVKNGFGLRSLVRVWKTKIGAEKYFMELFGIVEMPKFLESVDNSPNKNLSNL